MSTLFSFCQWLAETPFSGYSAAPNGTSIALLAEYGGAAAYLLFIAALDSAFPHGPIEQLLARLFA